VPPVFQQSDDILGVRPERDARIGEPDAAARPLEQLAPGLAGKLAARPSIRKLRVERSLYPCGR